MVKTAEQKVRDRYRAYLANGKSPRALTDANKAILEEVRAEAGNGPHLAAASSSSKRSRVLQIEAAPAAPEPAAPLAGEKEAA